MLNERGLLAHSLTHSLTSQTYSMNPNSNARWNDVRSISCLYIHSTTCNRNQHGLRRPTSLVVLSFLVPGTTTRKTNLVTWGSKKKRERRGERERELEKEGEDVMLDRKGRSEREGNTKQTAGSDFDK